MIRPKLNKIRQKSDDLLIQIIDWNSYDIPDEDEDDENDSDEENRNKFIKNRSFIIRGYGVTDDGNSVSIHVKDFTPYFFIKIPQY